MKKLKRLKWLAIILLICGVLLVIGFFCRVSLLRGLANEWIVNEPLTKADAIVVLGGGPDTRPFEGARLYHLGLAPKILLMNPKPSPPAQLGLVPREAELSRSILLNQGVPAGDIIVPEDVVTNSFDESIVVRNWAKASGAKKVIVPTDVFHTRRVRWLYHKELAGTGVEVEIEAVPVHQYAVDDWWKHEEGIIAFQNEVLKYAYYRLKY